MTARRISLTDTAKMVRAALREAFPNTTFSVRSQRYSGGCQINVFWMNGPAEKLVQPIVERFEGKQFDPTSFDGPNRVTQTITHPDGSVEQVRFAADFIYLERTHDPDAETEAAEAAVRDDDAFGLFNGIRLAVG